MRAALACSLTGWVPINGRAKKPKKEKIVKIRSNHYMDSVMAAYQGGAAKYVKLVVS